MFLVIPLLIRHAAFLIINEAKALRKQFRTAYFPFINEPQFFITINHSHKVIPVVYTSFITLMSGHQHSLGPQKIWNCLFIQRASILARYFNLRIRQRSISMVFSLFLGTAYMFLWNNGIATAGLQLVGYPNVSRELLKMCTNRLRSTSMLNNLFRMHQKALFWTLF